MRVRLEPMPKQDFLAYVNERAIPSYAEDQVSAGNWAPENALEQAKQAFARLLPRGGIPENQAALTVVDCESDEEVGIVWYLIDRNQPQPRAFICEFEIWEDYRRQGYGTQALHALEAKIRSQGINQIGLHVFGHNHPARALYEKIGYRATSVTMVKEIQE